jgi:peptidoglycan hydrolase CwlO-like protein
MTDRNYYRMSEDSLLLEEAKYNPTAELAVILAERLDDVLLEADTDIEEARERAADFERDAAKLDDEIYLLQQKIDVLELMLSERDDTINNMAEEIEELKEQIYD